jgi:hypothetical protein
MEFKVLFFFLSFIMLKGTNLFFKESCNKLPIFTEKHEYFIFEETPDECC